MAVALGTPSGGGGGTTDHGALMGLSDDDHLQYLLVSGTRAMSGNLDMGANDIVNVGLVDGVDISAHVADASIHFTEASISHLNIQDIGVNSHAAIDSHIADGTIHFTEASIDHTAISNIGVNSHAAIDSHIADGTIHFTEASIDHTAILNVGTNTHAQIDSHIADASIHFTEASIDHTNILNIGTNSHAQIDTHIADTSIHFADAPADDEIYGRRNNAWVEIENSGGAGINGIWQFDSSTSTGPSDGEFRYDNASYASVTEIFINDETKPGFDATNFLSQLSSGDRIYIQNTEDSSEWAVWDVNAAVTDEGDWFRIPVDLVANGSTLTAGKECIIAILYGGGSGGTSHSSLSGLSADDHTQYALLAGRAGGQQLIGGTAATEELELRGSSNADLGIITVSSPIEQGEISASPNLIAYTWDSTFTTGGPFIGGMISDRGTITYNNSLFIWALLAEQRIYLAAAAPGFAAFTLFNAIPTITNSGNFDLVQMLYLNCGGIHQRQTSGTSTSAQQIGVSFAGRLQTTVSGAVMTLTSGMTGLRMSPVFSTVAGSTINYGPIFGVDCAQPAVALFGSQAGTETMTSYTGLRMRAMTFGGNVLKEAVRCELTPASNSYCINNTGGAQSDFGGGNLLDCNIVQCLTDSFGLSLGAGGGDVQILFDGTDLVFDPVVGDNLDINFSTVSGRDTYIFRAEDFAVSETNYTEARFGFDRFAFGQTGAVGNQVGVFVAPSRTVNVAGGWADFLLTQAGNLDINGLAMSDVSAWVINAISLDALGGGSISDIATFRVGGMTTSLISANVTAALNVTGRSVFRGSVNLDPISPAQITSDQNDYAGHGSGNSQRTVVRLDTDASRTITGFDKSISRDNDTIWAVNVGANNVVLAHQNAGSAAANRIISPTGANLTLAPDDAALMWYDDVTTRWRVLQTTGT